MTLYKNRHVHAAILLFLLAGSRNVPAQSARVAVVQPPGLIKPSWSNNKFQVSIVTVLDKTYTLEYTTSLTPAQWTTVTNITGSGAEQVMTDSAATGPQRFYRVRFQ